MKNNPAAFKLNNFFLELGLEMEARNPIICIIYFLYFLRTYFLN